MPDRPSPISVPLDAAGRTVRAEVVRGPREDGRYYWRAREEHAASREDRSTEVFDGRRWCTASEAHRALVLYAAHVASPTPTSRLRTVGEVLSAWVATVRGRSDLAATSRSQYELRARALVADVETARLGTERIARAQLEDMRDRLLATHASKTVQGLLAVLRMAWAWARERGYVPAELPRVIVRVRASRAKPIGTPGDAAALLPYLSGWHEAAFRIILATGARPGEAAGITRASCAELDQGWLRLDGKTGPRVVPIDAHGPAAAALRRELAQRDRLAPVVRGTGLLDAAIARAGARAGLDLTPYAWRRGVAVRLRRAGIDRDERAAFLGHGVDVHESEYDIIERSDLASAVQRAGLEELPRGQVLELSAHNSAHTQKRRA